MTTTLTAEQFGELPDYAKPAFVKDGDNYVPAKDGILKETLGNMSKEKQALEAKIGELTKAEETRLLELEEAKRVAREEAIEEAQKKGNWEEQERLLREKFEDELSREREAVRDEVTKEFTVQAATNLMDSDAELIAEKLALNSDLKPTLLMVIQSRMKLDEKAERVYMNARGGALSIEGNEAFIADLEKDPAVMPLIKGKSPSQGGGLADGGLGGGAVTKKPSEMTSAERIEFKQRDPAGFKQAFNL